MPKTSHATDPQKRKIKQSIELEDFEFKLRERIVLTPIAERGGRLPDVSDLENPALESLVREMAG